MCLTPRIPEAVDFPRCNTSEMDWYMTMSTHPAPVEPEVEMQPELCEEEDAILKLTFLMIGNQLGH